MYILFKKYKALKWTVFEFYGVLLLFNACNKFVEALQILLIKQYSYYFQNLAETEIIKKFVPSKNVNKFNDNVLSTITYFCTN